MSGADSCNSIVTASGPSTNSRLSRALRTLVQSLVTPVITTSLYFVVFGAAIGVAHDAP